MLKRHFKMVKNHSSKRLENAETDSLSCGSTTIDMNQRDCDRLDALDAPTHNRLEHAGSTFYASKQMEESGHRLDVLGMEVYGSSSSPRGSMSRIPSRLGMRRRSISYPDMFEGDISNLMCKKPLSSVFSASQNLPTSIMEDKASEGLILKIDRQPRRRKLSEKIFSTWFFKKGDDCGEDELSSSPPDDDKRKISLSSLVGKKFTAAKDFRQLNIAVPQSM